MECEGITHHFTTLLQGDQDTNRVRHGMFSQSIKVGFRKLFLAFFNQRQGRLPSNIHRGISVVGEVVRLRLRLMYSNLLSGCLVGFIYIVICCFVNFKL